MTLFVVFFACVVRAVYSNVRPVNKAAKKDANWIDLGPLLPSRELVACHSIAVLYS